MGYGTFFLRLAVVVVTARAQGTFPCNFDTGFCAWTQDSTDDFDWTRTNGSTTSPDTGPSADHTSRNGYYAYIETSNPRIQNDTARLFSPWMDGSARCLTFWYHMYGSALGNLNVYIRSGSSLDVRVFTQSGPSSSSWVQANLDLSSTTPLQIVVEATTGSNYRGDIAIDDIGFAAGTCTRAEGEIRLINGTHPWEGRVEIYLNGTWGTLCDDGWGNNEAEVVCRQLGQNISYAQAFSLAHFGQGFGSILLDDVGCSGSESRLTDCTSNPVGTHNCNHPEDAGVACYPITTGQTCQDQCQNYCGTTDLTFHGSGGAIVNVAYNKSADMSSVHEDSRGVSGSACMAVNGRTSTTYRTLTENYTNCVYTAFNDTRAYWSVDLGRQYTVRDISMYRRTDLGGSSQHLMAGLSVFVENETTRRECYSFPNSTDRTALSNIPWKIDITCDPPLTGRKVWLQKHGEDTSRSYYPIGVCEVQVWACRDGLYGQNCAHNCSGNCKDGSPCDNYYGTCPAGCREGYTGTDCRCGHCKDYEICDVTNKTCPNGCDKGWLGLYCNQRSIANKDVDVALIAGACVGGLVILVVIAAVVFVMIRRSRMRSASSSSVDTRTVCDQGYQVELPNTAVPNPCYVDDEHFYDVMQWEEEPAYSPHEVSRK